MKQYFSIDEIIVLAKKMVETPSHEGIENQESAVAEILLDFFRVEGIPAEVIHVADGRCNVIATIKGKGGGKNLLLCGHTDTVPPYDMPDPFDFRIIEGKMYGRGINDMKGQNACMAVAMAAIKRSGLELSGDITFAGVIDEEAKSLGAIALIKNGLSAHGVVVGEGTDFTICPSQKGLEWLQFNFHGKTVHGGRQNIGINAIEKAAKFIEKVEKELRPKIEGRTHPNFSVSSSMNYGMIKGGTQPSTVAGDCILQIDRRWIPGEKYDDVLGEYENILQELRDTDPEFSADLQVMESSLMEPDYIHEVMNTDRNEEIVRIAEKTVAEAMGRPPLLDTIPAWTDGGLFFTYGKIPTIVLGPGSIETAHSADEHLAVDQLIPAVLIYSQIAKEFCR